MERITKHSPNTTHENGICCTHFGCPDCLAAEGDCADGCRREEAAWARLAAYEDTGLTPAEVRSMHGEWQAMMSVLNSIGGYDRLREMAEADKEGRVAMLRCKPGDKAYLTRAWYKQAVNPIEATVTQVVTYGGDRLVYTMRPSDGSTWEFADEDVGRLVFLSLEEAEKASEEAIV